MECFSGLTRLSPLGVFRAPSSSFRPSILQFRIHIFDYGAVRMERKTVLSGPYCVGIVSFLGRGYFYFLFGQEYGHLYVTTLTSLNDVVKMSYVECFEK